jgi:hypothetical protein
MPSPYGFDSRPSWRAARNRSLDRRRGGAPRGCECDQRAGDGPERDAQERQILDHEAAEGRERRKAAGRGPSSGPVIKKLEVIAKKRAAEEAEPGRERPGPADDRQQRGPMA